MWASMGSQLKAKHKPVAYKDDMEFYTPEQYKSFDMDLQEDLIPLYLGADSMNMNDEYVVCSLEQAEAFANKRLTMKGNTMSRYWDISNSIDVIQYKLENLANTVEILAVDTVDDPLSGALWMVRDVIEMHTKALEELSASVMQDHVASKKIPTEKKASKK